MMITINKSRAYFFVRLAFGIFLIILLIKIIDFQRLGFVLAKVKLPFIALGFLLVGFNLILKTYRWAFILWSQKHDITFSQLLRFNFMSMFLGHFLPTSISCDIVRFYYLNKYTSDPQNAISSIVMDRIIGIFSIAIVTIIAFIAIQQTNLFKIGPLVSYGIFGCLFLSIGIPLSLQSSALTDWIIRLLRRFNGSKIIKKIQGIFEQFLLYQHKRAVMLKVLLIAFLNLFTAVLEFYVIAGGFSVQISMGYYFLFIPIAIFLSMLPVSVGGIGVLEVSLVYFFSKIGMPVETCVAIALIHRIIVLIGTLPGGIVYVLEGFSGKNYPFRKDDTDRYHLGI